LNWTKSGRDRILGGEGLESPRNRQARGERALNRLGVSLGCQLEGSREEKEVQEEVTIDQRVEYPGDQTCPVNRPDLSDGMPDRTCLL
jgi:hypothetical protein